MKKIFTTFTAFLMVFGLFAQSPAKFWQDLPMAEMNLTETPNLNVDANKVRTLSLDFEAMAAHLEKAPLEGSSASYVELDFPMPDGTVRQFAVQNSPIMEAGLAAQYPQIKTFAGRSLNGDGSYLRFVFSPIGGLHALLISDHEQVRLTAIGEGQVEYYQSYFRSDIELDPDAAPWECGVTHEDEAAHLMAEAEKISDNVLEFNSRNPLGVTDRHEYRLAVATTGEFYRDYDGAPASTVGSVAVVLNYVTEVVSDINTVFMRDAAILLVLIDNTTEVFYDTGFDDPYTNGDTEAMLNENPGVLNDILGSSSYDVGHVFGTNAGGLASLGSVCSGANKARGASCTFGNHQGDDFFLIPAHELGHMFSATHTFNLCDGDNETPSTGYEPGAGSTIMSYSGASTCSVYWPQLLADPYFHNNSMVRIQDYSRDVATGATCAEIITVGNNMPDVDIPFGEGVFIPISTPFQLTAEASDIDGDDLTYCWEQYDLGPASPLGSPIGNAPSFRSYFPVDDPTRVFPRLQRVVENVNHPHEVLPTYSRDFTFRCTVRDNNEEAGAWAFDEVAFEATEAAGPFLVMNPNDGTESWEVGAFVEVTWDVANTDASPVNCQSVNILLSLDGGYTYPITLLSNTENDGAEMVSVPNEITDMARVRVEANDNIFFDISNNDFSIVDATQPGFALSVNAEGTLACLPNPFEIEIVTESLLGFAEQITFSASGLPNGAIANFSANPVAPGDNLMLILDMDNVDVSGDFTISILAEADGVTPAERMVNFTVVDNDFSALQLTAPAGASGTTTLPEFAWSVLPNALSYNIQIATDPSFTDIIEENTELTVTTYTPSVQLEEDEVYYWRVSANNECGTGAGGGIGAFKTVAQTCQVLSDNMNVGIGSANGTVVSSTLNLPTGGEVSDVNVNNITGEYFAFGDLEIRLNHGGESVILVSELPSCFVFSPINVGFDDEAPSSDVPCPPDNGNSYKPIEALSAFDNMDGQGEWTLEIEVVTNLGDGGEFDGWELEVCGAAAPLDPYIVTNDVLDVLPGDSKKLYTFLDIQDDDNFASELTVTIVENVKFGTLSLEGTDLGVGDSFTMLDVFSSKVAYTNTEMMATNDSFSFTVDDTDGGFLGTPVFNIEIDENALPESTDEVLDSDQLLVYPNPATNFLNVEFLNEVRGELRADIFNAQGQLLLSRKFDSAFGKIQIDVADLPTGFHLLQMTTENGIYAKKVMVE